MNTLKRLSLFLFAIAIATLVAASVITSSNDDQQSPPVVHRTSLTMENNNIDHKLNHNNNNNNNIYNNNNNNNNINNNNINNNNINNNNINNNNINNNNNNNNDAPRPPPVHPRTPVEHQREGDNGGKGDDGIDGPPSEKPGEKAGAAKKRRAPTVVSADGRVALRFVSSKVRAELVGPVASVTLEHLFSNGDVGTAKDALYSIPIDAGAAVSGFAAVVDGKRIEGVVHPKAKAREVYRRAVSSGRKAALLEEETGDVFSLSIGNVPPGADARVTITYVADVLPEGPGAFRFSAPAIVAERYGGRETSLLGDGARASGGDRAVAANFSPEKVSFDVAMRVRMPTRVRKVESPTHRISVDIAPEGDPNVARISLGDAPGENRASDGEFVAIVHVKEAGAELAVASAVRADGARNPAAMVTFVSDVVVARENLRDTSRAEGPLNLFVVVDRSGSMGGTKMRRVKDALQILLRSMPPGMRFNIISFGSSMGSLWELGSPQVLTDDSLAAATRHVMDMSANYGGTEILKPVTSVAAVARKLRAESGARSKVLFMTDGQVWNTNDVVQTVSASRTRDGTQWFTIGIGSDASRELAMSMAEYGGGEVEFVSDREAADDKVIRQLGRLLTTQISVSVAWMRRDGTRVCDDSGGGLSVPVVNRPITMSDGDRVTVYALCDGIVPDDVELTFTSSGTHMEVKRLLPVTDDSSALGGALTSIAARGIARDILAFCDEQHDDKDRYSDGRSTGTVKCPRTSKLRAKDAVTEIGVKYGIATRYTSFVAVEETNRDDEKAKRIDERDEATGDEKMAVDAEDSVADKERAEVEEDAEEEAVAEAVEDAGAEKEAEAAADATERTAVRAERVEETRNARVVCTSSGIIPLLNLQRADGSWQGIAEVAKGIVELLGRRDSEVLALVKRGDAWATAAVVKALMESCPAHLLRYQLRFIIEKATAWLNGLDGDRARDAGADAARVIVN